MHFNWDIRNWHWDVLWFPPKYQSTMGSSKAMDSPWFTARIPLRLPHSDGNSWCSHHRWCGHVPKLYLTAGITFSNGPILFRNLGRDQHSPASGIDILRMLWYEFWGTLQMLQPSLWAPLPTVVVSSELGIYMDLPFLEPYINPYINHQPININHH